MPTVSDITTTLLSGLNHIDALLDIGPDWNYLTPVGNTILYTFSVASGNETGQAGQQAFSVSQQAAARSAMQYISKLTGVNFVETTSGTAAQVHMCTVDLVPANEIGLCSWTASYTTQGTALASYDANAYVYLDNREWGAITANLTPGGLGYETLLHELGHMLGLKHPFEDSIRLPAAQDTTAYTLMSYTDAAGGPYSTFRPYDVAALNWIYGGDGLRGDLGINSATGARFITGTELADTLTGTAFNDTLEGDGGNDLIDGGAGTDTAIFRGNFATYTFARAAGGALQVTGADGVDILTSIEILKFSDVSVLSTQLAGIVAPVAPTALVSNTGGNQPSFSGTGDAGTTIQLINGKLAIGQTTVAADGTWRIDSKPLPNGSYDLTVTSTDKTGNATAAIAHPGFAISSSLNRTGTAANDTLFGSAGNNAIDGAGGTDTVVYGGPRANFSVSKEVLGMSITDKVGANGVDSLINVERIKFDDVSMALDVNGVGGEAYRLYQAAFDRQPDLAGLGFWIKSMDAGMTVNDAAAGFMGSAEFTSLYGANPTDQAFVSRLYANVLHRPPEQSGFDYWVNALQVDHLARAAVLGLFSESAENQAQVIGSIQNGFAFVPYG